MNEFNAQIQIIGINPFVFIPKNILEDIFKQAGKAKSPIPICGTINGKPYRQTLMKYQGEWRLYINTLMLEKSPKRIGETISLTVAFDPTDRSIKPHPKFLHALQNNPKAKLKFESLIPSLQKEIIRYISSLKTEKSVDSNVKRAIDFLLGKSSFVGREKLL
ncbi:MAG TPA: YdeI/OmpD-associated family protein [Pelobium sp.]|nr:YdeI/OmpD-associated family protein [Pelobium sp.]